MPSDDDPRRVVCYGRLSLDRHDSKSVDDQLTELRAWANREGWSIVAEYRDDGISASSYANGKARPGWQAVMDLLNSGAVDTLAVWELSRASRDRAVWAALLAACQERGVLIATGGRLHDPSDPDDGFALDLGGALAVREVSMTRKRTRRAVESRAAIGKPHAALPFGYRRVCDTTTGRTLHWEADPEQAAVVTEIAARLLAHEPAEAIANDLNRRRIPAGRGGRWFGGSLGKLARLPAYAGLRALRGEVLDGVKANWPPLISEADHFRLVALFADPQRDKFRNATTVKHLGSGIYRCGRPGCDGRMRVVVVDGGQRNRYDCRACHKVSRLQRPVDELIEALLVARLSAPGLLESLAAGDDAEALAARDEAVRLRVKLAELRAAYDDDRLSLGSFTDLEPRLLSRIRNAERRARPRDVPGAVADVAGSEAAARWVATPITGRRIILDALLEVEILPTERRFAAFDPSTIRAVWKGTQ